MTATLTFNEAHPELVQGMAVTGPGLDDAETEKGRHQGDAVILQIASDKKSVILSQVVNTPSTSATFTFLPPKSLLYTPTAEGDPGYPLIGDKFEFSNEPAVARSLRVLPASLFDHGLDEPDRPPEQRQRVQIHAGHCRRQHGIHLHQ